ncbi:MAG: molybdopterin cofactor-binding domain-containing protein [Thalassobaculum sp.]
MASGWRPHNRLAGRTRFGAGIGCMWYGCGNTSMTNPSTMRLALKRDGRLTLFNGAVDIGQGSYTIMAQIAADALGAPLERIDQVWGDTDLTPDAGKTSASRQTFVSGRASELAGRDLRAKLLRLANAGEDADLTFADGRIVVRDAAGTRDLDLSVLPVDGDGHLLVGRRHVRSADRAARWRRPGHPLRDLRLRGADRSWSRSTQTWAPRRFGT